ncbi:hypothetical protein RM844_05895 [Streptomyces sp. DSM 44915]|uniref:Uncharacterized protein n=1 Tax=Streptomyces chisholmiae TaxID=3075540 RepID=A0ABU2JLH7_9ACTN|nr:hypothetical protein [Streptomyces sp. DSM 44915]MDT0265820.1 hypothetical protein [Streptomyces sp. DSM 44915]
MPRSRPGRVRAGQRPRGPAQEDQRLRRAGLSAATRAEIAGIERRRGYLWPGATATALRHWRDFAHDPYRRLRVADDGGCGVWECCGDPFEARDFLEAVLLALSRRGRRELRALVDSLDARY